MLHIRFKARMLLWAHRSPCHLCHHYCWLLMLPNSTLAFFPQANCHNYDPHVIVHSPPGWLPWTTCNSTFTLRLTAITCVCISGSVPLLFPDPVPRPHAHLHQLHRLYPPPPLRLLSAEEESATVTRQHAPEAAAEKPRALPWQVISRSPIFML